MENINKLYSARLLREVKDFSPTHKAYRIYILCKIRGKYNIAARIANRYGRHFPKCDSSIAFMHALMATKSQTSNSQE